MGETGATDETSPTSGHYFTIELPVITRIRWPDGCAECGRRRPVVEVRRRVHAMQGGARKLERRTVMVPICRRCRWRPGPAAGAACAVAGSVFSLVTGTGRARHGIGPFVHSHWLWAAGLLLPLLGTYLIFRRPRHCDIAGDGRVLRWSFPHLRFATQFAAAHDARIEPPTTHTAEPATAHEPALDEHDAMD